MPTREYYQKKKEYLRDYQRQYRIDHPEKFNTEETKEYFKNYSKDYRKLPSNKAKMSARSKVSYQIHKGAVERQGCEVSGCDTLGHAHHDDYDKPLAIRWLCRLHHEALHHNILNRRYSA